LNDKEEVGISGSPVEQVSDIVNLPTLESSRVILSQKEKQRRLDKALSELRKKYKTDKDSVIITTASKLVPKVKIPFGVPSIDIATGGGLDMGRFTTMFGGMGTAKSTLAYKLIASAQSMKLTPMLVDAEHRFSKHWAVVNGVDIDNLYHIEPDEGASAEQILDLYIELAKNRAADLIIFDSISALSPREELDKSLEQNTMALIARDLSRFFRKSAAINSKANICCLIIGQLRASLSLYPRVIDGLTGGLALRSWSQYIICTSKKNLPSKSTIPKGEGFCLTLNILKAAGPGGTIELEFKEGLGIDNVIDLINLGINSNVIKRSGMMYSFLENKYKGIGAITDAARNNTDMQYQLLQCIKDTGYIIGEAAAPADEESPIEKPLVEDDTIADDIIVDTNVDTDIDSKE
jgi:recombination protein RecA